MRTWYFTTKLCVLEEFLVNNTLLDLFVESEITDHLFFVIFKLYVAINSETKFLWFLFPWLFFSHVDVLSRKLLLTHTSLLTVSHLDGSSGLLCIVDLNFTCLNIRQSIFSQINASEGSIPRASLVLHKRLEFGEFVSLLGEINLEKNRNIENWTAQINRLT